MVQRSRFFAFFAVAALGSMLWAAETSTVTITNKSSWQIDQLYMSPADSDEWGPDQLGDKVIKPGDSFALTDIPCNRWDLKVVDEDGDECELRKVDLCAHEAKWDITNDELLTCEGHK